MNKKSITTALFLASIWFGQAQQLSQKVGTNPTLIQPSAALEVESTTKGFLPPRMTNEQMTTIQTPATGLIVYCTNCSPAGLRVYDGSTWAGSPSVVADCDVNGFVGAYISGFRLTGASFSVTVTNNTFSVATLAFQSSDLVLSGVIGISVNTPTPTSATLNPGQSQLVTYPIAGTPFVGGTLTGTWSKLSLTCQKVKTLLGNATFTLPQSKFASSIYDGTPLVDIQGYITNTPPNRFVINVPYTGGVGSYNAYTSSLVTGTAGEGGDVNDFSISYPAGTFSASGTIPVTVTVHGDSSYSAKKQLFGGQETIANLPFLCNGSLKGYIVLGAFGGILDKMFGLPDGEGNTSTHNFSYLPVTGPDGKTWLNNNLGAHYANMNHGSYNLAQQATSATDYLAYGSKLQWGRKADGHELINYTNTFVGTAVNGTTSTISNAPANALFIVNTNPNSDWRSTQDDTLWATETSANNPCPVGYRVPTQSEQSTLVTAGITDSATALSSALKYTISGYRDYVNGDVTSIGAGYYWSSSVSGTGATTQYISAGGISAYPYYRAYGMAVRCIKD